MAEGKSEYLEESQIHSDRNPKKRKNELSILTNCYSCNFYSPLSPQTLTSLKTLDSEWRIVLLCETCLNLINSSVKCAFCFSNFEKHGKDQFLDCIQCSRRIHLNCVLREQRFVSLPCLKSESFVCIDCCAIPRVGSGIHKSQMFKVCLDEIVGKENEGSDCGDIRDEELALKLHLAMNGSRRITRSGENNTGKVKNKEICRKNKKENDMCSSSSNDSNITATSAKGDESCSDKVMNSSSKGKFDGWITYHRTSKSKGVELQKISFEDKHSLDDENISSLGENNRVDVHDRFANKYYRRKTKETHVGSSAVAKCTRFERKRWWNPMYEAPAR